MIRTGDSKTSRIIPQWGNGVNNQLTVCRGVINPLFNDLLTELSTALVDGWKAPEQGTTNHTPMQLHWIAVRQDAKTPGRGQSTRRDSRGGALKRSRTARALTSSPKSAHGQPLSLRCPLLSGRRHHNIGALLINYICTDVHHLIGITSAC